MSIYIRDIQITKDANKTRFIYLYRVYMHGICACRYEEPPYRKLKYMCAYKELVPPVFFYSFANRLLVYQAPRFSVKLNVTPYTIFFWGKRFVLILLICKLANSEQPFKMFISQFTLLCTIILCISLPASQPAPLRENKKIKIKKTILFLYIIYAIDGKSTYLN